MRLINKIKHYEEIDFIKMFAIISVVLLHTIPSKQLYIMISPFHIWQSIPIFMTIAGVCSSLSIMKNGINILRPLKRILIPYSILWFFNFTLHIPAKFTFSSLFNSYIQGIGPGSYFIILFIQHILIFPFMWLLVIKLEKYKKPFPILRVFFYISLMLEWGCIMSMMSSSLYRLLYVRYFFNVFIGIYIVRYGVNKKILLLSIFSFVYIFFVEYIPHPTFIKNALYPINTWGSQHSPSAFFVLLLIVVSWRLYFYIRPLARHLLIIGKSSFHIYLIQGFYFYKFGVHTNNKIIMNVLVCCFFGILFYKKQKCIENQVKKFMLTIKEKLILIFLFMKGMRE